MMKSREAKTSIAFGRNNSTRIIFRFRHGGSGWALGRSSTKINFFKKW